MESRSSHIAVGSFVLILLASLFAFAIWTAKVQFGKVNDIYRIVLTGSVTGLQEGSPVRYLGIPVGTVTNLRFDREGVGRIVATIEVDRGTPIRSDSVASLEVQGLTGGAYIQINGGSEQAPLLTPEGGGVPTIPSRPSRLAEVVDAAPLLLAKAAVVLDRLSSLATDENRAALTATLANGERMSRTLADASADAARAIKSADALVRTLNDRTAPQVTETLAALQTSLKTLTEATVETERSLRQTSGQLGGVIGDNRQAIRDFTATGLYDATQLIGQLRDLTDRLSRFVARLDSDPSSVLFGGTRQGLRMDGK
jgi:phospholipid/cholesterol/gamma-HCH transport system substrate-binding protein